MTGKVKLVDHPSRKGDWLPVIMFLVILFGVGMGVAREAHWGPWFFLSSGD